MIYTDGIHMVATTLKELHSFATTIGIKKCYYEGYKKGHPHYDLVKQWMKKKALDNGAILISSKEIITLFKENKIQASENLYRDYRKVDKEKTVDYPKVLKNGKQTHLMGYDNPATEQFLQYVNGVYGKEKQIKYFVYVWPDSASINVVENQKAYWLRCNKNEFILCLFVDRNGQVKNIDFITWSEKNYNPVLSYKGTVEEVVRKTWDYLESNWVRLEFSKFEFLTVRPSNTAFVLTLLANLIILSIIMSLFFRNIHEKNTIT